MNIKDYSKVTDRLIPAERCRNEVLDMSRKHNETGHRKIHLSKRGTAALIAAAVAACGGTAVFAAERLGVFNRMSDTLSQSYVDDRGNEHTADKWEQRDFEQIGKAAKVFEKPITIEDDEINITVESVYCDGYSLILGISASLTNGNPEGFTYIPYDPVVKRENKTYAKSWQDGLIDMACKLYLDNGTTNSFSGTLSMTFDSENRITDTEDIVFRMHHFRPNSNPNGRTDGIGGCDTPALSDEISFDLSITPDESSARCIDHVFTDSEGYFIPIVKITPIAIQIQVWDYPDELADHLEPYQAENPDSKLYAVWTDSNGKELEGMSIMKPLVLEDGRKVAFRQPPTSDIINIKFYDANKTNENYEPYFVHEMTIDLENLTVIE